MLCGGGGGSGEGFRDCRGVVRQRSRMAENRAAGVNGGGRGKVGRGVEDGVFRLSRQEEAGQAATAGSAQSALAAVRRV